MRSYSEDAYSNAINAIEAGEDTDSAFTVLLGLAKDGYVDAMNHVANCYAAGVAVEKDLPEALRWWKQGAARGRQIMYDQYCN